MTKIPIVVIWILFYYGMFFIFDDNYRPGTAYLTGP